MERSRASARFSGRKNHCAQISFVLYQAMGASHAARSLCATSPSTRAPFEDREQRRRRPDRAARAYLTLIFRHPEAVVEALAS
jgi:hypothetical protein